MYKQNGGKKIMERRLEYMRPSQILAEKERCSVIYVPVAPLEWHGPHLPLGTDPLRAREVALRAAAITGGVVMPTLFWGTERERSPELLKSIGFKGDEWIIGMDFPNNAMKSLYAKEEFFSIVVRETLNLLVKQGYRVIAIVNGHGAENHMAVLKRLAAEFTAESPATVIYSFVAVEDGNVQLNFGHADREETSVMMALCPENVDLGTLPPKGQPLYNLDWAIVDDQTFRLNPSPDFTVRDDPRNASPQEGEENIRAGANHVALKVKEALEKL
ncbi:MAG: creatininase family protein [Firmicutes bacterium]|nr:creatininase family protein [Bacillota bacterium]